MVGTVSVMNEASRLLMLSLEINTLNRNTYGATCRLDIADRKAAPLQVAAEGTGTVWK